ncbi:hypothetical protein CWC22_005450 [Pseudoalteromonas rubra]|uniref:Uncharacterized protein n=1 Tax=Pseudoalteromonas rubra TaxID=43658 RepID=A0A5S3URK3_9GAMM|nr:hypothetical protein [Pseudoalteromonas rubra]QPB82459.1 hypothetical protein CWC22_005450 [Pseudoalteromonas rubra]
MNTSELYKHMLETTLKAVGEEAKPLLAPLEKALEAQRESIQALVQAHLNNEISGEDMESELLREQKILEAELISLEICAKAVVQKAVAAAMSSLTSLLTR